MKRPEPVRLTEGQVTASGAVLARAMAKCRLFTEGSRNVPLYQRYGFEIAVEGDLPDGGPNFWFMRRRPRPIEPRAGG
jgi:hypothetical protein